MSWAAHTDELLTVENRRRCVLAVLLGIVATIASAWADEPRAEFHHPVVIKLEGLLTPLTEQFLRRQLDSAKRAGADLVIVEIDSPGGLVESSVNMARLLAQVNWAKTVAFVSRQAISGGAIAALGCEEIIMTPDAHIGDAGPIVLGDDMMFRHAPEKMVSFLASVVREVSQRRGHSPALAEAMVDKDLEVTIYRHKTTGETRCFSDREFLELKDRADWEKVRAVPGSGNGRFLTMTGEIALETGLASANVANFDELKTRFGLKTPPPVFEFTWVDTLVGVLNSPFVSVALLVLGLVFLFIELYMPGIGIFGILSFLSFGVFFWSHFLGGTATVLEILLFVTGLACIIIELLVLPGTMIFGVAGALLVLGALTMAVVPHLGQVPNQMESIAGAATTVGVSLTVFIIVGAIMTRYLGVLPVFRGMMLAPPEGSIDGVADAEPSPLQVGLMGIARTPLRPAGKARLDGRDYDVVAEGSFIQQGEDVRVVLVQGNRIVVRAAGD